jgi:hypothetical protein
MVTPLVAFTNKPFSKMSCVVKVVSAEIVFASNADGKSRLIILTFLVGEYINLLFPDISLCKLYWVD